MSSSIVAAGTIIHSTATWEQIPTTRTLVDGLWIGTKFSGFDHICIDDKTGRCIDCQVKAYRISASQFKTSICPTHKQYSELWKCLCNLCLSEYERAIKIVDDGQSTAELSIYKRKKNMESLFKVFSQIVIE